MRRTTRRTVLAGMTAMLALGFTGMLRAEDEKVTGDLKKLQGTWVSESGPESKWSFDGEKLKATVNGGDYICTVKVDSKASPATMDLDIKEGAAAGQASKAIYKFDGEKLVICVTHPGVADRPTKFEAVEDSVILFELKKEAN